MLSFIVLLTAAAAISIFGGKRGKRAGAVMGLMLLVCTLGAASAAGIQEVPEERIWWDAPGGMVCEPHISNGQLKLTIDTRSTDWGYALLWSSDPSYVDVNVGIHAPAGAAYYALECGSEDNEEEILEWLDDWDPDDYNDESIAKNGQMVAQCVNEYRVVKPYLENTYLYVRWFDAAYQEICTEKLHFTSQFTMTDGLYAPLYQIGTGDITPNATSVGGVTAQVAEGLVTYRCTGTSSKDDSTIWTYVRAPQGATECRLLSLYDPDMALPIQNGQVLLEVESLQSRIDRRTYGLEFLDNNGTRLSCGLLTVQCFPEEAEPWPAYISKWEPVPSDHLLLSFDGNSGVSMPYEKGVLSYDFSQIVDDPETLDGSRVSISVAPPANARYVRQNCMGGYEGLLGNRGESTEEADDIVGNMDAETVAGPVNAGEWPVLQRLDIYDGVTLFIPTVPTNLDAGMVYLFYWYESEEDLNSNQPCAVWWFAEQSGPYVKAITYHARPSETGLPMSFDGAIVIGSEDWNLVTETYLQQGENARHYELRLTDRDGNTIAPNRNLVIYLPYPDGLSFKDPMTYTLRHYSAQDNQEIVTTLTPTEIGLRFEVNNLSPFVLQWRSQPAPVQPTVPPAGELPQTGDDTPVAAAIVLLILSAAGLACLLRRKRCL